MEKSLYREEPKLFDFSCR